MEGGKLKNLYLLIIVPIGIVLGLFGYIGSFNRLLGDSFCSFFHAEKLGLLRSIWYWRITWSGRYTAFAFDWAVMKVFGAEYISLFIPIVLIIWVFINTGTAYLLLRQNSHSKDKLQLASILGFASVFLILTNSPSIQQSFLWLDGFRAYTLPIIILPAYFSLYLYFSDRIKSEASLIISAFVAFWGFFISGGLSETYSVFQLTLLVFLIAYYWITEQPTTLDKNLIILVSGLIGTLISILVIVTAPGNPVRQSFFPPPPGLFELIRISFFGYFNFLNKLLL